MEPWRLRLNNNFQIKIHTPSLSSDSAMNPFKTSAKRNLQSRALEPFKGAFLRHNSERVSRLDVAAHSKTNCYTLRFTVLLLCRITQQYPPPSFSKLISLHIAFVYVSVMTEAPTQSLYDLVKFLFFCRSPRRPNVASLSYET